MSDPGASGLFLAALGIGVLLVIPGIYLVAAVARGVEALRVRRVVRELRRRRA